MSNSPWDEQIAIIVSPAPSIRPHWPWEQPDLVQRSSDFLRGYICEAYLVRAFDETMRYVHGYGLGYNFISDNEATFAVRASCITPTTRSWKCNFGRIDADFILFFGFRDRADPRLEFCLNIPMRRFEDRTGITILDDGYHIKGYKEFWVDEEIFAKMQAVMDAIKSHDSTVLEQYEPRSSR